MPACYALFSTARVMRTSVWLFCGCLLWPSLCSSPLVADEDVPSQFLSKLRERKWHDVALEYLERATDDPLASPEFIARIPFEQAITRLALAKDANRQADRQRLTQEAIALLLEFANEHPDSARSFEAMSQAGNLLAEQALQTLAQAERVGEQASVGESPLHTQARELFEEAATVVRLLLDQSEQKLQSLPRGAAIQADKEAMELRQVLQAKLAEGQFLLGNLAFEKSRTYPQGSSEREVALDEAASLFAQLHQDYENKLVGFYGRLYEGRCYQNKGDYEQALECFDDLVDQPIRESEFRRLVARAYRHRAECLLAMGDVDQAIEESSRWLDQARSDERTQAEWLAVAYRLAEAYEAKSRDEASPAEAAKLRLEARKHLREVSRQAGEFQRDARTALAANADGEQKPVDVKSFADAFTAGKNALEQMSSSQLAARLAKNNNPEAVSRLEEQADSNRTLATTYFRAAVDLIDQKSPIEDVVTTRYYLCWLTWEAGDYAEAARMGAELAEEHPESEHALTAARIALAAYEKLVRSEDHPEASEQLSAMAELIVERWPKSTEAATAANLLMNLAIREDRLSDAQQLLDRLPAENRASAELNLGSSLWSRYLTTSSGNAGDLPSEASQLRRRAGELLASGFNALDDGSRPSMNEATGILYYLQFLIAEGNFDEAAAVLERPTLGPLAIAEVDATGETERAFARETYKAGLQTFVSTDPPRRDDAVAMMENLEKLAGSGADSQQQLTNIYISLSLQLQQQVAELTEAGKNDEARTVAATFEDLLGRVAERSDSKSWAVQTWLAQTSLNLGEGLSGSDAQRYIEQAENIFRDIVEQADKDPGFAPSQQHLLAVRKQLGDCLVARGEFSAALNQYQEILEAHPNMLELQKATASLLQQWGMAEENAERLEHSIRGTLPGADGRNLVWGWLRIATLADLGKRRAMQTAGDAAPNEKQVQRYEDLFFEARYRAAEARLAAANLSSGARQQQQLDTVRQSVEAMKQLYPDLGGPRWQSRFESLLEQLAGSS